MRRAMVGLMVLLAFVGSIEAGAATPPEGVDSRPGVQDAERSMAAQLDRAEEFPAPIVSDAVRQQLESQGPAAREAIGDVTAAAASFDPCVSETHSDAVGDAFGPLDLDAYGLGYYCEDDTMVVVATTANNWADSSLYLFTTWIDADRNSATGCYGNEFAVAADADNAVLFSNPTCGPATPIMSVFVSRPDLYAIGVALPLGAVGYPKAFKWSVTLTDQSLTDDDGPDPFPNAHTTYRPTGFLYYLKNSFSGGAADVFFAYGDPTDTVLVGDWNNDNADTLGVRRGNAYFLTNTTTGGAADVVFSYGNPDDVVLVGDWDGDGVDTLGVRRGNTYFLTNSLTGGVASQVFSYGNPDDVVLIGDWDGDGDDSIAVRRGNTYYLKNSFAGGAADTVFSYGNPDDVVLFGDWDNVGGDSIAVRRGNTYYLKNGFGGGAADTVFSYGNPDDTVLIGDWDGDGADSFGLRR